MPRENDREGGTRSDEDALLSAAKGGDREALERLLLKYYRQIETHIARRVGPDLRLPIDQEAVLQQTLWSAFKNIESYDESRSSFCTWILSIANHQVIDAARANTRVKRGGGWHRIDLAGGSAMVEDLLGGLASDGVKPESPLRREEARQAIQVGLANLSSAQRHAVIAYYFEQRDIRDIASELDRSPHAVSELLRRGREKLREALGRASQWLDSR